MAEQSVVEGGEGRRGFLLLSVLEARGKTSEERNAFAASASADGADSYVKVEVRGAVRRTKAVTSKAQLQGDTLTWNEDLQLEVLEGGSELRIMLCRDAITPAGKKGVLVVAACGLYVDDVVAAVPFDKYFELFKPSGEGGFIRIAMHFVSDLAELEQPIVPLQQVAHDAAAVQEQQGSAAGGAPAPAVDEPLEVPTTAKHGRVHGGGAACVAAKLGLLGLIGVIVGGGATAAGVVVARRRKQQAKKKSSSALLAAVPAPSAPVAAPAAHPKQGILWF